VIVSWGEDAVGESFESLHSVCIYFAISWIFGSSLSLF
jgi:hypothetical protein